MFLFTDFRERRKEGGKENGKEGRETDRQTDIDLLFHLSLYSLADSYICPDWGSNPQLWDTRTTL